MIAALMLNKETAESAEQEQSNAISQHHQSRLLYPMMKLHPLRHRRDEHIDRHVEQQVG